MGHGYTNAADGLTAIKKVVYEDKIYTLDAVITALDTDFEGYEDIRKALLAAPKYGNDVDSADMMLSNLWHDISVEAKKAGAECGLDFHTLASANPGGYAMGLEMGATADGRFSKKPFAICNAPTAGNDKNGLTALMNSILKTHPANGGTITNFKVSREFFIHEREKFEALFAAYWDGGGQQANIAIVNKGDLEAALENPEHYPNLLVRMGGWTARFVDLERYIQEEIITRTLY
jgi:pyruvate-formate lyase